MRLADRLLVLLAPPLAAALIWLLQSTIRRRIVGLERLTAQWQAGRQVILCSWHDQLLLQIFAYPRKGAYCLISASKDGELLTRTLAFFGHHCVRGSSNRGGLEALRQLLRLARQPADIALTPDGPRGPRHQVKDGVLHLAKRSGRPILPLAYACSRGHRFSSWDRFLLSAPFCRAVYVYGEAVFPREGEDMEPFRRRLMLAMETADRQAHAELEAQGATAV